MGKAGRVACIFVPYAMTLVSLVLLVIVELGGKSTGSSLLNDVYTWQADFTNVTNPTGSDIGNKLQALKSSGELANVYQIHIYNYCSSNRTDGVINYCSERQNGFVFDFINTWHLNDATTSTTKRQSPYASPANSVSDAANDTDAKIKQIFGQGVVDALNAYRTASKWMSIAFQVALWTSVATAVSGILAVFSRWGSFITWIFSVTSTIFGFGAAITASIIFGALIGTLKTVLDPYKVSIDLGSQFLAYIWISSALSLGATLFWLFSICCCSGRSNPYHKSNKGGLWHAEPKDGFGGRGMRVQQTGGYQRVSSPYMGAGDRVPLHDYPAPMPEGGQHQQQHLGPYQYAGVYEPYRHER